MPHVAHCVRSPLSPSPTLWRATAYLLASSAALAASAQAAPTGAAHKLAVDKLDRRAHV